MLVLEEIKNTDPLPPARIELIKAEIKKELEAEGFKAAAERKGSDLSIM